MLMAGLAGAASRAAAGTEPPPSGQLGFRVVRMGREIGRHLVIFQPHGAELTVRIAVDAVVTLLSIPVVRYSHRAEEIWSGGILMQVTATTAKNGEREWMQARRDQAGLSVTGSQTRAYVAPPGALATSYWNKRMLLAPMVSLEDGVLLRPAVAAHPDEAVTLASGQVIAADHYSLRGALNVDLWYDRNDRWAGFAFRAGDGSTVHYERL